MASCQRRKRQRSWVSVENSRRVGGNGVECIEGVKLNMEAQMVKRTPVNLITGNLVCHYQVFLHLSGSSHVAQNWHAVILVYSGEKRGRETVYKAFSVRMK